MVSSVLVEILRGKVADVWRRIGSTDIFSHGWFAE